VKASTTKSRQLRSNMTDAERKLWTVLRMRQLEGRRFRRQVPIGPYIVDFVCLEARLIIEVDGGQHNATQLEHDVARDRWLSSQHFRVLRFWNNDVMANMDGVAERILQMIKEQSPPSQPSPVKGEGAAA